MFLKRHGLFTLLGCIAILGCRPKGTGSCANPQALVDDSSAIQVASPVTPAGGFIHIGARTCTVTFTFISANESSIRVNAFSAQHCFREDTLASDDVRVSVYLPAGDGFKAGYLKELKAHDDFFERKGAFLNEVRKLNSPEALKMSERAVKIPLFATMGFSSQDPVSTNLDTELRTDDPFLRNVCISNARDKLNIPDSQEICLSALDSSVRLLEFKTQELGEKNFDRFRKLLEKQNAHHQRVLKNFPSIAAQFNLWSSRIQSTVGAWRQRQYVELASFLNAEVCSKYLSADDPTKSVCTVRSEMIEIVKKHLVEIDVDGKKKSIIEKIDELGFGLSTPFLRPGEHCAKDSPACFVYARDLLQAKMSDEFFSHFNKSMNDLRNIFRVEKEKLNRLGKHYTIAANPFLRGTDSKNSQLLFALIDSDILNANANSVSSKGLSAMGTLRLYLPNKDLKIKFGPTDSGAMLTFGGVVPLLVLNTVNGEPTSGGASILALPEPAVDDESSTISRISNSKNTAPTISTKVGQASQPAQTGAQSTSADKPPSTSQIEISAPGLLVSSASGESLVDCR